jgi:hypothetical protein
MGHFSNGPPTAAVEDKRIQLRLLRDGFVQNITTSKRTFEDNLRGNVGPILIRRWPGLGPTSDSGMTTGRL